jgi:hypothetical protein
LPLDGCRDRIARAGECDEERVALGPHLYAVVGSECFAQELAVDVLELGVALVTDLAHGLRRPLDVCEQERDGSRGQCRHSPLPPGPHDAGPWDIPSVDDYVVTRIGRPVRSSESNCDLVEPWFPDQSMPTGSNWR